MRSTSDIEIKLTADSDCPFRTSHLMLLRYAAESGKVIVKNGHINLERQIE